MQSIESSSYIDQAPIELDAIGIYPIKIRLAPSLTAFIGFPAKINNFWY